MTQPNTRKITIILISIAAFWLLSKYLLPVLLPFLLAAILALAAEPLVRTFSGKLHLPRGVASFLGISVALTCAVILVLCLCALALRQLGALSGVLPSVSNAAVSGLNSLENFLLGLSAKTPENIQTVLNSSIENLFSDSTKLVSRAMDGLLSVASGVLTKIPDSALGFGTWILASFMISAKLPAIRAFLRLRIPQTQRLQLRARLSHLRKNIALWLTAELKLSCVTFLVLTLGFLLLRISYAPLWAALISLVDALPILGSGTVLGPWSIISLLQGDTAQGLGLLGIWGTASLLRTTLEPRLVGKQLGLDPLVTLLAMYTGYRLWGILGMISAPLLAVTFTQLTLPPADTEKH